MIAAKKTVCHVLPLLEIFATSTANPLNAVAIWATLMHTIFAMLKFLSKIFKF
jgi:hypothetical protein